MTQLRIYCLIFVFCAAAATTAPAQNISYSTVASFNGTNGARPYLMALVQGSDGNLYGTTWEGGSYSYGTVFSVTPGGTLTALYSFCSDSPSCPDGYYPYAGLVQGSDGNFYGTATWGGAYGNNNCAYYGQNPCGAVFKITPTGAFTLLYSFCALGFPCPDGDAPYTPLVPGGDSNFYGTTGGGGEYGAGTVFKITTSGTLTTMQSFNGSAGNNPSGLMLGSDWNFYGTAHNGGAQWFEPCPPEGCGTVFKMTRDGTLTPLYSFCHQTGCPDGAGPYGGLVQTSDGSFYGTTSYGGNTACGYDGQGCGTVFKITANGTFALLYTFCSQPNCTDGASPTAGLVQGSDGNFYGTTTSGGALGCGTVFGITPQGALTTLHSFCSGGTYADGAYPSGGLVQASNGFFYGTTNGGGIYRDGTVFRFSVTDRCATCRP
jgi:uncharacterized repeat protein (TIGR03803 family)